MAVLESNAGMTCLFLQILNQTIRGIFKIIHLKIKVRYENNTKKNNKQILL